MEKMQNTLANKATLKMMLEKQKVELAASHSKSKQRHDSEDLEDSGDEVGELPPPAAAQQDAISTNRYSISKKKIERSRKITMFIKLENTKDEASTGANLNGILTKYDSTTRSNDMSIRGYLQGQDKAIRERIEMKRSR
eukprot:TRINITY_DN7111_c0_g1_i4.p1 TRINITY_DN7111_c0_g1~~TRINITY_DN7111_c0_g1_i4.p1  ORF type:complete len:139 (-),score=37.19 TRINITY_DN7111_c0_g1_i4:28-444(-)